MFGHNCDSVFNIIGEALRNEGFIRHGSVFRLSAHGNCAVVEFQKSDKSSAEKLRFTINLGIICGRLFEAGLRDFERLDITDAHLRLRIGMLLPGRPDKWWEVGVSTDLASLSQELTDLLLALAVPYLKSHLRTQDMIALWESGRSPGLTEVQRSRFLSKLKSSVDLNSTRQP